MEFTEPATDRTISQYIDFVGGYSGGFRQVRDNGSWVVYAARSSGFYLYGSVVPEPVTALVMGAGLAALVRRRRLAGAR